MFFPDVAFIPFLRSVDEIVKKVINVNALLNDDGIIKVKFIYKTHTAYFVCIQAAHDKVKEQSSLKSTFQKILTEQLPNVGTFSQDALDNVYNVLVRKLCYTRVQEVVSAARQQLACKKGLASTVDVNL